MFDWNEVIAPGIAADTGHERNAMKAY